MGTNYYLHKMPVQKYSHCSRCYSENVLHIGKSSYGWKFSLHIIPENNIISLNDWIVEWNKEHTYIKNEYGEKIPPEQMLAIITERGGGRYCRKDTNLMSHVVDGRHCVFSSNTYSLIIGDFS